MVTMKRHGRGGFTLMELLIVVIIIGILATLALPQFSRVIDQSREAEAMNMIGSILSAELLYYQEKLVFTTASTDLSIGIPVMKNWSTPSFSISGSTIGVFSGGTPHTHGAHTVRGTIDNSGAKSITQTGRM